MKRHGWAGLVASRWPPSPAQNLLDFDDWMQRIGSEA
jgi:hypothetical protein